MKCSVHRWHKCPAMGLVVKIWPLRGWARRSRERWDTEFARQYKEAYERVPLDAPDAWGDMASFLDEMHRRPGHVRD